MTRMSMCVLGSGSAGNCTIIRVNNSDDGSRLPLREGEGGGSRPRITGAPASPITAPFSFLIDLGLSPRQTRLRLQSVGASLDDVTNVLITHFDQDHFDPAWIHVAPRHNWTLHIHRAHRGVAHRAGAFAVRSDIFDDDPFTLGPANNSTLLIQPLRFAHDTLGTVGFRFDASISASIGDSDNSAPALAFATDLGAVSPSMLDAFANVNLLAIESNYCPRLQEKSNRPDFVKRRIMGGRGHLSNEQSFAAVKRILATSDNLQHIVLLHLSRQCNDPVRLRAIYSKRPDLASRLTLTSQDQPTPWLHVTSNPLPEREGGGSDSQSTPSARRTRRACQHSLWPSHSSISSS